MFASIKRNAGFGVAALVFLAVSGIADAASATVDVFEATKEGRGKRLGQVTIEEIPYGLVFTPSLQGLKAGGHGFHVHANNDCGPDPDANTGEIIPAGNAGGHYDPAATNQHGYPWGDGHLGDLPLLDVDAEGNAKTPVLAPRLTSLDQIRNRALMVHAGGDNYSDQPKALGGGGGGRMACGVIR